MGTSITLLFRMHNSSILRVYLLIEIWNRNLTKNSEKGHSENAIYLPNQVILETSHS